MRLLALALLACATTLAAGRPARAGYILQFADGSGTPRSAFEIPAPGATVDVRVYLAQTGADTLLTTQGLLGAGSLVTRGGAAPGAAAATLITANPAFDTPLTNSPAAGRLEVFTFGDPVLAGPNGRLLIGTYRFTGQSPGALTLTVADPNPGFDDFVTADGTVLDPLIAPGTATLAVRGGGGPAVVTPAPAGLAVALGAPILLAARAVRRKSR